VVSDNSDKNHSRNIKILAQNNQAKRQTLTSISMHFSTLTTIVKQSGEHSGEQFSMICRHADRHSRHTQ